MRLSGEVPGSVSSATTQRWKGLGGSPPTGPTGSTAPLETQAPRSRLRTRGGAATAPGPLPPPRSSHCPRLPRLLRRLPGLLWAPPGRVTPLLAASLRLPLPPGVPTGFLTWFSPKGHRRPGAPSPVAARPLCSVSLNAPRSGGSFRAHGLLEQGLCGQGQMSPEMALS